MNKPSPVFDPEVAARATAALIIKTTESIGADLEPLFPNSSGSVKKGIATSKSISISQNQLAFSYRKWMATLRPHIYMEYPPLPMDLGYFLSSCVVNCENLEDVIRTAARFVQMGGWSKLAIDVGVHDCIIQMETYQLPDRLPAFSWRFFGLVFYYKLFSWLIGEPLLAPRLWLTHSELASASLLENIVPCSLRLESKSDMLAFEASMLKRPVVRRHQDLVNLLKKSPMELIAVQPHRNLSAYIEELFQKELTEKNKISQLDRVAYLLGQSAPTLRRRLFKEGASFQEIANRCRKKRAIELLGNPALTVEQIADNLGFNASSGFSRAFKEWTGLAPSEYRQSVATGEIQH